MTQEYTPVSWQDETTSQQGTLINAERLNQMQTAHHYADGFEEVDTAPTADPGVGYHKVVYCTADSTFYRWDGTQWQKDIDDDTKALLLAHEADHANPHQVTKAQVGLGNADNTSDLDKPVSTATQTALDGKVPIRTANDGKTRLYSYYDATQGALVASSYADADTVAIRGTYGRLQVGTPSADADAVPKKYADDGLATKADKATTYTKTETDTLLAGKADQATTLAGYGITDAYTKTEADTLLGAKADNNAVVHLAGAETIPGVKTFTGVPTIRTESADSNNLHLRNDNITLADMTGGHNTAIAFKGANDALLARLRYRNGVISNQPTRNFQVDLFDSGGTAHTFELARLSNGVESYPALDGYLPMVRTTGNQNIAGVKTYTGKQIISYTNLELYNSALYAQSQGYDLSSPPTYATRTLMQFYTGANLDQVASRDECALATGGNSRSIIVHSFSSGDVDQTATFSVTSFRDGSACMRGPSRAYSAGNTTDIVNIALLDAYTPMVRTTGNQTKAGQLILQGGQNEQRITVKSTNLDLNNPGAGTRNSSLISFTDVNDNWLAYFYVSQKSDKSTALIAWVRNADGSTKSVTIAEGA